MKIKRNKLGQFISQSNKKISPLPKKKAISVKNGSLYSWRGMTVRVLSDLNNGMKLVSSHKSLFGFAKPDELNKIDKSEVNKYLFS